MISSSDSGSTDKILPIGGPRGAAFGPMKRSEHSRAAVANRGGKITFPFPPRPGAAEWWQNRVLGFGPRDGRGRPKGPKNGPEPQWGPPGGVWDRFRRIAKRISLGVGSTLRQYSQKPEFGRLVLRLARAHPLLSFRNGRALPGGRGGFPRPLHDWGRRREKKLSPRVCDSREIATLAARRQAMAVRRLYEPLCIAFGTTVSSPTVPTYQLFGLPHKQVHTPSGIVQARSAV